MNATFVVVQSILVGCFWMPLAQGTGRLQDRLKRLCLCYQPSLTNMHYLGVNKVGNDVTRSQAVARIADRTASQHLWGARDVIGHVAIWHPVCHFLLVVLWQGDYLQPFLRYCALNILGSRAWPFRVTWRHRSRDYLIPRMSFPIGGPLERSLYL